VSEPPPAGPRIRLDDPELVACEYARPERLAHRMRVLRECTDGPNPLDVVAAAVEEVAPAVVVDVGCGDGDLAARLARRGRVVRALDIAPAMVEAARARGVDATVGDARALPLADGSVDCAVAAWMLYHVPEPERALAEICRVLVPGGRLVAAFFSRDSMGELWEVLGTEDPGGVPVAADEAHDLLAPFFARIERREVVGRVTFADAGELRAFLASSIRRAHLADRVPDRLAPVTATSRHGVFVCDRPRT
jgi:ubiquinone/menaquinone biosynthesis C-methylase UbiE